MVLAVTVSAGSNSFDVGPAQEEERADDYHDVASLLVDYGVGSIELVGGSDLTVERTVRSNGGRGPTERA